MFAKRTLLVLQSQGLLVPQLRDVDKSKLYSSPLSRECGIAKMFRFAE